MTNFKIRLNILKSLGFLAVDNFIQKNNSGAIIIKRLYNVLMYRLLLK